MALPTWRGAWASLHPVRTRAALPGKFSPSISQMHRVGDALVWATQALGHAVVMISVAVPRAWFKCLPVLSPPGKLNRVI